jgi:hypothetical protein
VTASSDHTARIWTARESVRLEDQILWDASAQTDPLSEVDRAQLGLPRDPRARSWPTQGSACDQAAAAVYDPDRLTPGVLTENVSAEIAYPACSAEIRDPRHAARADYQMGRTLAAKGDANGGRQQFEIAVRRGYREVSRMSSSKMRARAGLGAKTTPTFSCRYRRSTSM